MHAAGVRVHSWSLVMLLTATPSQPEPPKPESFPPEPKKAKNASRRDAVSQREEVWVGAPGLGLRSGGPRRRGRGSARQELVRLWAPAGGGPVIDAELRRRLSSPGS
ncbi:unnamed protein product [Prorocentrum cordatum]|uniref:Uncharacterized protein n=1 Tax=Prorocentrum cordatum TaxID=2364126 RepID=A0ABN9WZ91_9DINO|nr:unnamed protein product [Polarella glacialis]